MSLILIVEDNEKNMKLMRDILQAKGYETVEAGTAEDGIRLALECVPDLVLMDIQLSGINGMEALKMLRANAATALPYAMFVRRHAKLISRDDVGAPEIRVPARFGSSARAHTSQIPKR